MTPTVCECRTVVLEEGSQTCMVCKRPVPTLNGRPVRRPQKGLQFGGKHRKARQQRFDAKQRKAGEEKALMADDSMAPVDEFTGLKLHSHYMQPSMPEGVTDAMLQDAAESMGRRIRDMVDRAILGARMWPGEPMDVVVGGRAFTIVASPVVPPGEAWAIQGGKRVCTITGLT